MSGARSWRLGKDRNVTLEPWCLMGILNATPDSFSDGGDHLDPERAIASGLGMIEAGATVLDVGCGSGVFLFRG